MSAPERKRITERILDEVKGRMLEEIVQLETKKTNPDLEVFKLQSNRIQIWNNSGESSSLSWRKYRSRTGNYLQKCRGLSLRFGKNSYAENYKKYNPDEKFVMM